MSVPFHAGDHVFRTGDRFEAIYAVRAGMVKTRLIDDVGREQVLGFHLPGEMVGLNAIHPAKYPCDAIALDTVYVCRFSFPALTTLAAKIPDVQQQMFRLLSADIGKAMQLAGDHSADERLAAFLLGLAERYAAARLFILGVPACHGARRHRQLSAPGRGNRQSGPASFPGQGPDPRRRSRRRTDRRCGPAPACPQSLACLKPHRESRIILTWIRVRTNKLPLRSVPSDLRGASRSAAAFASRQAMNHG